MTEVPSKANREIARREIAAFEAKEKDWRVTCYWDDDHVSSVDVLHARNRPIRSVSSYGTIGLSDTPLVLDGKEYPTRVELVGACLAKFKAYPNVLATAAFYVINSGFFCFPGAILPDVVSMYKASRTLKHVYFGNPFVWGEALSSLDLGTKRVSWLMLVPISDRERTLAESDGPEVLVKLLEEKEVDVFDLDRKSAI